MCIEWKVCKNASSVETENLEKIRILCAFFDCLKSAKIGYCSNTLQFFKEACKIAHFPTFLVNVSIKKNFRDIRSLAYLNWLLFGTGPFQTIKKMHIQFLFFLGYSMLLFDQLQCISKLVKAQFQCESVLVFRLKLRWFMNHVGVFHGERERWNL